MTPTFYNQTTQLSEIFSQIFPEAKPCIPDEAHLDTVRRVGTVLTGKDG
jgi:hypothetical protein